MLPADFNFAFFFNQSLDAHTVNLVNTSPASFVGVAALVVLSEFAVRGLGPSSTAAQLRVGGALTVTLFFAFGAALAAAFVALYAACLRALAALVSSSLLKFGCEDERG